MPLSQAEILEKYKELPDDLKKALFSGLSADRVFEISKKYELNIEQGGKLAQQIGLVLLGDRRARDLPENIVKVLGIPQEKSWEIARDVNHMIFFEVRENLKKVQGIPETEALLPDEGRVPLKREEPAAPAPASLVNDKQYWDTLKEVKPEALSITPSPKATPPAAPKKSDEARIPIRTAPRAVPDFSQVEAELAKAKPPVPESVKLPLVIRPEPMENPNLPGLSAVEKKAEAGKPALPPEAKPGLLSTQPEPTKASPAAVPPPASDIARPAPASKPALVPAPAGQKHDPYREPIEEE